MSTSKGRKERDRHEGLWDASAPYILYPTVIKWRGLVRWELGAGSDMGGGKWRSNKLIFCATAPERLCPSTGLWEEKRIPSNTAGRQLGSCGLDLLAQREGTQSSCASHSVTVTGLQ